MADRTVLVHADGSRHAAALAHAHGAMLLGAAFTSISRAVFPEGFDNRPGTLAAGWFEPLADNARHAPDACAAIAEDVGGACDRRLVSDQPDDGLALLAR